MKRLAGILVLALLAAAAAWWLLWPTGHLDPGGRLGLFGNSPGPTPFLGYVEAETLLIAPKQTGRLVELDAVKGAEAVAGDNLFALDTDMQASAVEEAAARLDGARARLDDLREARQRPAQIEVLEARRRQAEASLDLSRAELERQQQLFDQAVIAKARLDQARTAYKRDQSALAEAEREIDAAQLPGREAELAGARADVQAGEAALEQARVALAEQRVAAPESGRVLDLLYRVGEVVPAGQAVVELLPPGNIVLRFYVPETAVAGLTPGGRVAVTCDGCPAVDSPGRLTGEIGFIASEAEFTPPVIFSRQERAKLVFLVEARPSAPSDFLKPGLPVEILPLARAP